MKILVCSNNSTLVTQLKTEFQGPGLSILKIENAEVVQLPDEPLLVLLDSEYSQEAVLAAIHLRQNQRLGKLPIRTILLAPQDELKTIEEAIDYGFDDFLISPFTRAELSSRVKLNLHLLEKQSQPSHSDENLIFENAPVSLWQEDFSTLKERIEQLRAEGIENFRQYFQAHPEVVVECATLVKVLDVNRKALELHRANSKAELLAGITKTFTEESFMVFREELIALTEGKTHFRSEAIVKTLDGEKRNVILQLFIEPGSRAWSQVYLALTDISEQKKAEDELREHEQRYRDLFNNMSSGVAVYEAVDDGADFIFTDFNRAGEQIENVKHQEIIGKRVTNVFPGVKEFGLLEVFRRVWKTGNPENHPVSIYADQRLQGWRDNYVYKLPSREVVAVYDDVTERKQAEFELQRSKESLRTTLHSIGDAVIATDTEQNILRMNPVAERLTGWSAEEAKGKPLQQIFNIFNSKTGQRTENPAVKALKTGNIVGLANHTILFSKDGTEYQIADSAAPIRDTENNITGVVLVFRDVTEEYRTREELQKIHTLERVGILAGGIAHDFNNILMGLFGNIAMAKRKLSSDHPGYENLQKAENSAERAKTLTGKLLTFAKGGEPIRDHVRLADLVKEIAAFDLSGSNVKLIFQHSEDLWTAEVDKGQIQQVFSNLTTNANQSMPEGGNLQINLQNLDNTDNLIQGLAPGKYIQAIIKDNGVGIEANDLPRIFDPYFSTRQAGSGLGLATVYSIIHKHDGQISVTSEPGNGATFTLLLPATDSAPPRKQTSEIKTTLPLFPSARILVMDDEESIRNLVTEMLKSSGYAVTTTCDCQDAITAYSQAREKGENFDIVILDLTIPGGDGGKKAVKDILQIDPEAKVIVASGYAEDPVMSRYQEYGFKGVITKPFALEELQRVLEKTLAS